MSQQLRTSIVMSYRSRNRRKFAQRQTKLTGATDSLNVTLADPNFHEPAKVDVLIGGECFWKLLCIGQFDLGQTQLTMHKTRLGWIVAGPSTYSSSNSLRCHFSKTTNIEQQVAKFWELEEYTNKKILSRRRRV